MSDAASPKDTQNFLISDRSVEKLQDLVDDKVRRDCVVDEWPEHWENSGATEVWKCSNCKRLYVSPRDPSNVVVYAIERTAI